MLIFDPHPPLVRWCAVREKERIEGQYRLDGDWTKSVAGLVEQADCIVYVLQHGGGEIRETACFLSSIQAWQLEACQKFAPEANRFTLQAIRTCLPQRPDVPHVLLCDTAFFAHLPPAAHTYGLPYELRAGGLRRYGGDGLCYHWAWNMAQSLVKGSGRRTLIVHLDDTPTVTGLVDGLAVETSLGFSGPAGIPSATGCGDLDPACVPLLNTRGWSPGDLERVFARESGFKALVGEECGLAGLLSRKDHDARTARAVLEHSLFKHVGACLAATGGLDCLLFVFQDQKTVSELVQKVCERLRFVGLKCSIQKDIGEGAIDWTAPGSKVSVLGLAYDRWQTLAYLAAGLFRPGADVA